MKEFENKVVGITYASRYIASWTKAHTSLKKVVYFGPEFVEWLMKEAGLSEEDARFVDNLARNGKLEFEANAEEFIMKKLSVIPE